MTQNSALKFSLLAMTAVCSVLAITSIRLAIKPPLIIERACWSNTVQAGDSKRTETEIKSFVRKALAQRFDSGAQNALGFLSPAEVGFRATEQEKLSSNGMKQSIIVNTVSVENDSITIDSDRLISVGAVRSAFPFPLSVSISTTSRSEDNPYGLILEKVSPIQEEKNAKTAD